MIDWYCQFNCLFTMKSGLSISKVENQETISFKQPITFWSYCIQIIYKFVILYINDLGVIWHVQQKVLKCYNATVPINLRWNIHFKLETKFRNEFRSCSTY